MVKNYNCEKCGKQFKQKSHYTAHSKRKIPCVNESKIKKNTEKVNELLNLQTTIEEPNVIIEAIVEATEDTVVEEVNENKLNVLDLFCGCGGMSKGITDAGLNIVAGIDIWDKAINSYKKNYEHKAICHDLTKLPPEVFSETYQVDVTSIDVIVGGPPCFIAGTKVLTDSGYKNIEDVVLEDKLLTHTGKFQNIVNLQKKYILVLYMNWIYYLLMKL